MKLAKSLKIEVTVSSAIPRYHILKNTFFCPPVCQAGNYLGVKSFFLESSYQFLSTAVVITYEVCYFILLQKIRKKVKYN